MTATATSYAQESLSSLYSGGGFTLDPLFGEKPRQGWAIGLPGHEVQIPLARITAGDIDSHARSIPVNAYQGGWVKDGIVYLDAVQIEPDRIEAIRLGMKYGQRAIYNLRTGEEIDLLELLRRAA